MIFILRAVLILLLFSFVVYVLKSIARISFHLRGTLREVRDLRTQVGGGPAAQAEMLRCAECGSFVSARDALTVSKRDRSLTFCSHECLRKQVAR